MARFKGDVPSFILGPHIFFMFFAMLWSIRAVLEAIVGGPKRRMLSVATLVMLLLGGTILTLVVMLLIGMQDLSDTWSSTSHLLMLGIVISAILAEAGLCFLGSGTPRQIQRWGHVISLGRIYFQIAPWIIFFPGVMLAITVLAINLMGDGLRDTLDPRIARRM